MKNILWKIKKKISIVTPCLNEEGNIENLYLEIKKIMHVFADRYDYEHIYIDNDSTDRSMALIRKICAQDKNVKAIFNSKNFGHIRSPIYGLYQASGDAAILMASDFQDPPALIPTLIGAMGKWLCRSKMCEK